MSAERNSFEFILQHGWGLSSSCWKDWVKILKGFGYLVHTPDRGYFGEKKETGTFITNGVKILVSHSFGLYLFSEEAMKQADILVIISGFKQFHPEDDRERRRSRLLMKFMKSKLMREPEKLLVDFYNGHDLRGESDLIPDQALLLEDLEAIDSMEPNMELISRIRNILIIHGEKDMVVRTSRITYLKESIPGSYLYTFQDGDHALPFVNPEDVISVVIDHCRNVAN